MNNVCNATYFCVSKSNLFPTSVNIKLRIQSFIRVDTGGGVGVVLGPCGLVGCH